MRYPVTVTQPALLAMRQMEETSMVTVIPVLGGFFFFLSKVPMRSRYKLKVKPWAVPKDQREGAAEGGVLVLLCIKRSKAKALVLHFIPV